MEFEAFENRFIKGEWRVEGFDQENGECQLAVFTGPKARQRADEYAAFKNSLEGLGN